MVLVWWTRPAVEIDGSSEVELAKVIERLPAREPAELAPDRPAPVVECELAQKTSSFERVLVEELDFDTLEPLPAVVGVVENRRWLRFQPQNNVGIGRVYRNERQVDAIGWFDGSCIDIIDTPTLPKVEVLFRVSGSEHFQDARLVASTGEGAMRAVDLEKGEASLPLTPGHAYQIVALVRYGVDEYRKTTTINVEEDLVVEMHMDVPEEPHDWRLREWEGEVIVARMWLDGEAALAGVHPGDVLVEADGEPAEGFTLEQLRIASRFVLDRNGERLEIAFE